jgi:hypothetical protein
MGIRIKKDISLETSRNYSIERIEEMQFLKLKEATIG